MKKWRSGLASQAGYGRSARERGDRVEGWTGLSVGLVLGNLVGALKALQRTALTDPSPLCERSSDFETTRYSVRSGYAPM